MRAEWAAGSVVVAGADLLGELAVVPWDAPLSAEGFVAMAGSWHRSGSAAGAGGSARAGGAGGSVSVVSVGSMGGAGGSGGLTDDVALFTPRFAPVLGSTYLIVTRAESGDSWTECARVVVGGAPAARSAVVVAIEPNVDEVPANLLRFAVTFSAEMEEGAAASHLHLLDSRGADVSGALYDLPPELWDRSRHRLTVLLEPGRIKRGLQPNAQAGAPLIEGETVTFAVGTGVRDARGAQLAVGASRAYRVGPAVRSRIDPVRWQVRWPKPVAVHSGAGAAVADVRNGEHAAEPVTALIITFERPLDRALALRCLRVRDAAGRPVPGDTTLNADATQWRFVPRVASDEGADRAAWRLHVDTRLEDLAGNSIRRVFDRDLSLAADDSIAATEIVLRPSDSGSGPGLSLH